MTPSADHPTPTDEREDERLPLRPGCGGALLGVFAAAGILVWALVAPAYILPTGTPRFPQQLGWDYYVLASALWGVGIGATGIFLILRRQRPHFADPVILLLFCDIGVVLAPVWPVFTIDKADPVVTLTIAPDASTPGLSAVARLDVEAYGSSLVLCRWQNDADEACNSGFHR
ncbi:hypothetical protein [Kitasatospora sp. P5_F3]